MNANAQRNAKWVESKYGFTHLVVGRTSLGSVFWNNGGFAARCDAFVIRKEGFKEIREAKEWLVNEIKATIVGILAELETLRGTE